MSKREIVRVIPPRERWLCYALELSCGHIAELPLEQEYYDYDDGVRYVREIGQEEAEERLDSDTPIRCLVCLAEEEAHREPDAGKRGAALRKILGEPGAILAELSRFTQRFELDLDEDEE